MQNSNNGAFRLITAVAATLAATATGAVDFQSNDWKFSVDGNINVHYIYSSCQSVDTAEKVDTVGGACTGTTSGSSVSNVGNGLLPAALTFGISTTQNGYDIAAHFGLYPGIASNDGGSPNLQATSKVTNVGLATTGLDVRQVYMTFGNKDIGTFTLGRNIGLFGADVILADMTLLGVGAPGSAASAAPSNTTLGGIGFGYIYTDWLAQIDYTTPDISGFAFTVGIFDPLNSLTDAGTVEPKKAPGVHGKISYTLPIAEGTKLYLSVAAITQQQDYQVPNLTPPPATTTNEYRGTGVDVFAKFDMQGLEVVGYYYHATGLGTTAFFDLGDFNNSTRTSNGYLAQVTYKIGAVKLGANYGASNLDYADSADQAANPTLVRSNRKGTLGVYYSLTKNLTLLAEGSRTKSESAAGSNDATTVNIGAFLGF